MTDYKLVPVEPTAEMVQAACDEEQRPLPMWIRMKAIYTAMLAAAPDHIADTRKMVASDVQGEPVALAASAQKPVGYVSKDFLDGKWSLDHIAKSDEGQISRTIPVFARPPQPTPCQECGGDGAGGEHEDDCAMAQHAEQPECGCCGQTVKCDPDCDAVILRKSDQQPAPQTEMLDDDSLARQIGEIGNQIHNLGCEHQNYEGLADRLAEIAHQAWMLQRSVMVSKQHPAPDAEGLVEALTELCDEIDKHEIHAAISKTSISWFKRKARAVLAAYRKGVNDAE